MSEKIDGNLGVVGGGTAALQAIVNDINIERRALYASKAQARARSTRVESATQMLFAAGC